MDLRRFGCRLIELREPFSKFRSAQTDDGVLARFVVRPPSKHLRTDHSLSKKMVLSGQRVPDDVAQQILALVCIAKRRASQYLIQGMQDRGGILCPAFLGLVRAENRIRFAVLISEGSAGKQV